MKVVFSFIVILNIFVCGYTSESSAPDSDSKVDSLITNLRWLSAKPQTVFIPNQITDYVSLQEFVSRNKSFSSTLLIKFGLYKTGYSSLLMRRRARFYAGKNANQIIAAVLIASVIYRKKYHPLIQDLATRCGATPYPVVDIMTCRWVVTDSLWRLYVHLFTYIKKHPNALIPKRRIFKSCLR